MGELILFPMRYVSFAKGERTCSIVYATSSSRIIKVIDLPLSWMHSDGTLAATRLISAGWEETSRGKVENDGD